MKTEKLDTMLTAEELRIRAQKRRRLILVLALTLVIGTLTFFAARPTRNAIKGWQARRHANKAFALIEQGQWNDARKEAVAAYQLRSTEPQALRAIARFLSRTRQQQALEFWDQLAQRDTLTREDLRDEAAVALVTGEAGRADRAIAQLLGEDGKNAAPSDWLLAAQLRLQEGAPDKALDSLGRLFAQPSATARELFQGTILQLQSARTNDEMVNQRAQSEAWERLNKLAQSDDAVALDALVLFAQRQLASQKSEDRSQTSAVSEPAANASPLNHSPTANNGLQSDEIIRRLKSHPLAKASQKLLAIDLQIQATPDDKESLVRQAISDWKEAEVSQLVVLATWLNGKGEFQQQLDQIPEEKALGSRELFLQRMDALGALGRWEEIRQLLASERFPLDQVMQRMYLARTNAQLGNEAAAKSNWQRALEAANGDAAKLMSLAEYAEKNGASEIAESAYTQAIAAAPKLRGAWQGQLRCVSAKRETRSIHTILTEMLKLWPNDTAIQNDEAYLRLLLLGSGSQLHPAAASGDAAYNDSSKKNPDDVALSEQLVAIENLAQELVRKEPSSLPHRTLLALALLRQGRSVAALQVYDGIQVAQNALTPSALAVHAAVLKANNQPNAAREEISHVPADKLLPEEQQGTANLRE